MGSKPAEQWNIQYEYITKIGNYYEWITEANREIHSNSFKLGIKKWIPEILWMNYRGQQEMKASNRYFSKTVNKIDWKRWMFCMSMLIYIHSLICTHRVCVCKCACDNCFICLALKSKNLNVRLLQQLSLCIGTFFQFHKHSLCLLLMLRYTVLKVEIIFMVGWSIGPQLLTHLLAVELHCAVQD